MGSRRLLWVLAAALGTAAVAAGAADGGTLPASFQETVVYSGLTAPTVVRFSPDGRVFVAEKSGIIKVYPSLTSTTPAVFADLRTEVDDYWDRGLLGLALDPAFPTQPYVYALYSRDAPVGGVTPVWGDACPTPPGPTTNGCVVSGRLVRLTATGDTATTTTTLVDDWCQQFPSHSIGSLQFGPDGALYASAGDGASFNAVDYGAIGTPRNPCGDPGTQTPGGAEGGSLRSQSLRRAPGDAVTLDGSILRLDPTTGQAAFGNPLGGSADANTRRIVAQGLRNPFRFTFRPGTSEVWVGDVGWDTWEEINRIVSPISSPVLNFGWPCYEGVGPQPGYQSANIGICQTLYGQAGSVSAPYYTYNHGSKIVTGETCPSGSSSISGLAFYTGSSYPAAYNGALFFSDYSRKCIWAMQAGANGLPDPAKLSTFDAGAAGPVHLEIGPNGDLFYADLGGTIRRIQYLGGNRAPVVSATATPTSGNAPLPVHFDGSASSDPDGDPLTYSWDLDGDGVFGDSTAVSPDYTYTRAGTYNVRLKVTDSRGASSIGDPIAISASNTPPTPTIDTPAAALTWRVGDPISFSGHAVDGQDGALPASALTWQINLQHCPSNCHTHVVQVFTGISSGSFNAPDHDYPSHLQLQLTATDSNGVSTTTSVDLQPRTVALSFASSPGGLQLTVGATSSTTPFSRTVIVGSSNSVSAPTPQSLAGTSYDFSAWSDGGAQTHAVVAGSTPGSYTASYAVSPPTDTSLVAAYAFDDGLGTSVRDTSGKSNNGTTTNTAWSTAGKYGGALSFNGSSSWVTVADAASLDLTTAMTLEAWVYPTATGVGWRTVLFKEQAGGMVYSLYANEETGRPLGQVNIGGERNSFGLTSVPLNTWTHLAATFDGASLRLYVNGSLVTTTAVAGSIPASTGALRIGGNSIWNEWYAGRIDEARVYDRALTAAQIQADMNAPIG